MSITDEVKKKIVLSILNVFAKTGALIGQINKEYEAQTGEKLANNRIEGEEYMRSFEEVYMERDRYFSASENSKHIQKMVVQQHTKFSANYRGQTGAHQNFNRLFPARQPAKITNRRSTCAAPTHRLHLLSSEPEPKKRRCDTPDRDRALNRTRSRSRSPLRRFESRRNRSRSRSPKRRTRPPISARYSPPRRRVSRSPPRDRRSISPRNKRSQSPIITRAERSPSRTRHQTNRTPARLPEQANNANNGAENSNLKDWTNKSEIKPHPAQINDPKMIKPKKFKFTIIGDGCIYYMLSDMHSDVKFNLTMCNHTLTIADALKMVETQHKTLQEKKRKVMIAIGATDIRNGRTLCEIKRDFTSLFLRCDGYGLKPLITTILCFDSPELREKAEYFNNFLIECFENVIIMRDVLKTGLADVMTSMNKKHAMKLNQNNLGLGTRQQLILNVPKE